MITSLKPLNLLLFDTYILGLLFLFIKWASVNCATHSNIWQLFYYIVIIARLLFDELESNSIISNTIYWVLTFISSAAVLLGMCIYEMVAIFQNSEGFDDPDKASACYQNRIFLVGQCIIGFLILFKDLIVLAYEKKAKKSVNNPLEA